MFGDTFSNNSLGDLQKTYYQQLETLNRMQQQQQATNTSILEEINKSVGMLNSEEQSVLASSHDYQLAKQTYEAGFMAYLGNKFAGEYVSSPDGKIAANNLLTTIKQQKERVNEGLRAKQQKIDKLLNLLENDPDLKKKYEEMLTNNQ